MTIRHNVRKEEIQANLKAALEKAHECLDNKTFKEYRSLFKLYEKERMNDIFNLRFTTAQEYGTIMFGIVTELKIAGKLLETVEDDAGVEEEE